VSREKLEALRKRKRLSELRAKASQGEPSQEEMSATDAGLIGAREGATFGLYDEGAAAISTADQVIEDAAGAYMKQGLSGVVDALPNITETYNDHLEKERRVIDKARKEHPASFLAGDIAGSIASSSVTLGLGKLVHAGRALKTTSGLISTHAALGFAHGVGRSEDETIAGTVKEGLEASVFGAAGEVVGPVAGVLRGKAGEALQDVSSAAFLQYLGVPAHKLKDNLKSVGKPVKDWSSRMLGMTDIEGKPLIKSTATREELLGSIVDKGRMEGKTMGKVLSKVDNNLDVSVDAESIYDDILDTVIDPLRDTIDPDDIKIADKLEKNIKAVLFKAPDVDPKTGMEKGIRQANENLNLTKLHEFNSRIYKDAKTVRKSGDTLVVRKQQAKEKIASRLKDHIDSTIEGVDDLEGSELLTEWRRSKESFGDLREAEKAIEASIKKNDGGGFIQEMMGDSIFKYTSAAGILTSMAGLPVGEIALATAALRAVAKSPLVNGWTANSAGRMSKALTENPQKYNHIAARLVSSVGIPTDAFMDNLQLSAAEIELMENPLQRTTEEVIKRKDAILTVVDNRDKEMASSLRDAIDRQDKAAIAGIMSTLAMDSDKIQKGIGFDGMAVTEQDQQEVGSWINRIKNPRKRMKLKSQFNKDFMIPEEMMMGEEGQAPDKFFQFNKARKGPGNNKI
jgi:hypothetical protein